MESDPAATTPVEVEQAKPVPAATNTPPTPEPVTAQPPAAVPAAAAATVEDDDGGDDDDDDSDDFDELDDMLDEFDDGTTKASKPGEPVINEGWARMLQEGMADLLNDVNQSPEMQGQCEKLAKELNDAMAAGEAATAGGASASGGAPAPAAGTGDTKAAADNFQDRIKATMDRMKSSNAEVDAGLADADSDDFLAEMLKSMGGAAGGEGGEEDFSTMLVNMMEQLTSKEILYEPMKELYEKYPEWIRKNESKESTENMTRYREQYAIVKEIVTKFDEPDYKDENESCREYIVERMQKMQTAGAPPQELMGDMGQGLDPPDIPSDCGVQ